VKRTHAFLGATLVGLVATLGIGATAADHPVGASQGPQAPAFEVDPFWPKPLPNHWVLGAVVGVGVDSRDHVFIIHRPASLAERAGVEASTDFPAGDCCRPAPPVLEFDPEGNLTSYWGGPGKGYTWPGASHGIALDPNDNVWIAGIGARDSHILKFTRTGKLLLQIGIPGQGSNSHSTDHFGGVAKISFNARGDEAYVADGYGNRRVVVLDAKTGVIKRYWGAYGNRPVDADPGLDDPNTPLAQQFGTPVHCAEPSDDGLVYVCDPSNARIQVFQANGAFVTERIIAPLQPGDGSTWDMAFSRDRSQQFLYLADGANMKVSILERGSLETLTSFGDGGRQPGLFSAVHSIATDSKGNIYTTEAGEGKRVQKFVYRGLGPVMARDQGAPWPRAR